MDEELAARSEEYMRQIISLESSEWQEAESHGASRGVLHAAVASAMGEVSDISALPDHLSVTIRPSSYGIIPETGANGYTVDTELIMLTFDPKVPHGLENLKKALRETTFHELNHVHRWMGIAYDDHILNSVVFEGLATVFEMEYARATPLYGAYQGEPVEEWLAELAGKTHADYEQYFFDHPDGRRWIGYKVGTWLVREAMRRSGKGVVELTRMAWRDIIKAAGKDVA